MATKDWYARRLGTPPAPTAPSNEPPTVFTPAVTPGYAPQFPQQTQPAQQQPEVEEYRPASAKHLSKTEPCPECGGMLTHYRWANQDNVRCPECGYPLEQSGTGEGHVQGDASARLAAGTYQPGTRTGTWGGINKSDNKTGFIGRDPRIRVGNQ